MRSRGGGGQSSALLGCLLLQLGGQQTEAASAHYSLNLTGIASGTGACVVTLDIEIGVEETVSWALLTRFRLAANQRTRSQWTLAR